MTFPKRGGYARDRRTGTYVKISETGPGPRSDWLVRPVYKSDGYWVAATDLEPARDPHAWTGAAAVWRLALVLVLQAWLSWGMWASTTGDPVGRVSVVTLATVSTARMLASLTGLRHT